MRRCRRDQVDRAADRIRAEERRARPMQHVDAGHGFERQRQIQVEMTGLWIVEAHPVHQDQRLLEGRAANRKIRLHAV